MKLQKAENPYQIKTAKQAATVSRAEELKRSTQSSLNKICPENVDVIVGKILDAQVASTDELELVIQQIMKKALTEPHYCETYADLVFSLKSKMPEFPAPDGGKPVSFKSTLLTVCQIEFEAMPATLEPPQEETAGCDPEEVEFMRTQRRNRILSLMKFIGHLFLRNLLVAKIIGQIIQELAMCGRTDDIPAEHVVECLCELLTTIGYTLESTPAGKAALSQVCGRLMELKKGKDKKGKSVMSKRIQFAIQDLLETREAGWTKKVFKTAAKTKDEIRIAQEREINAQAAGKDVLSGERIVAGARPACLQEREAGGSAGSASTKADGSAWQEVPKSRRDRN